MTHNDATLAPNLNFSGFVSKEGYKPYDDIVEFSVIEKEPVIMVLQECNSNLVCDSNENFMICPQDCKSGSKDDYCDEISEGVCDPDCTFEEDKDCTEEIEPVEKIKKEEIKEVEKEIEEEPEEGINVFVWGIVIFLIIMVVVLIVRSMRNKQH